MDDMAYEECDMTIELVHVQQQYQVFHHHTSSSHYLQPLSPPVAASEVTWSAQTSKQSPHSLVQPSTRPRSGRDTCPSLPPGAVSNESYRTRLSCTLEYYGEHTWRDSAPGPVIACVRCRVGRRPIWSRWRRGCQQSHQQNPSSSEEWASHGGWASVSRSR